MKKYNGYNGYYKGYEDEYETLTMSPWIEDVMSDMDKINTKEATYVKEELINAAYNQRSNIVSVTNTIFALLDKVETDKIRRSLVKAIDAEFKFLITNISLDESDFV